MEDASFATSQRIKTRDMIEKDRRGKKEGGKEGKEGRRRGGEGMEGRKGEEQDIWI